MLRNFVAILKELLVLTLDYLAQNSEQEHEGLKSRKCKNNKKSQIVESRYSNAKFLR